MFAVVKTGGKQYRVTPGDVVVVEKILGNPGDKIKLDHVLMVGEDGQSPEIGSPLVGNNVVNCLILEQSRSAKILVFKKKRRKGYKRTKGHRQDHTVLRVLDINGKGMVKQKSKTETTNKTETTKESKPKESTQTAAKNLAEAPNEEAASKKKKATAKKKASVKKKASTKKSTAKKN
ncbi:MAG: 50S ribosomal protein L21 [Alphaproteobacteria bacterium MarineAlpha3_Bin6]|nr:MAG: 50S ribosomal protein L21 [Alphaproteobacteria bacterium MarineAlpha3_Bin6]